MIFWKKKKWRQEWETHESSHLLLSVGLSKSPPWYFFELSSEISVKRLYTLTSSHYGFHGLQRNPWEIWHNVRPAPNQWFCSNTYLLSPLLQPSVLSFVSHFLCFSLILYHPQMFFSKVSFAYVNFDFLYVVHNPSYMLPVYTSGSLGRSLRVYCVLCAVSL